VRQPVLAFAGLEGGIDQDGSVELARGRNQPVHFYQQFVAEIWLLHIGHSAEPLGNMFASHRRGKNEWSASLEQKIGQFENRLRMQPYVEDGAVDAPAEKVGCIERRGGGPQYCRLVSPEIITNFVGEKIIVLDDQNAFASEIHVRPNCHC